MAVLWDRMVFSLSENSWKTSGFRTFLGSTKERHDTVSTPYTCTPGQDKTHES